jgi:hypothetical protein
MKKQQFTFTTAEGKVETRSSARPYTHVVVGRSDFNKQRAHVVAMRSKMAKNDRDNYRFWATCASTPVGAIYPGENFTVRQEAHDQGLKIIAAYPTVESYVAARADARYNAVPAGDTGPELVLQWSMTERAARAAVSAFLKFHSDVRVVAL